MTVHYSPATTGGWLALCAGLGASTSRVLVIDRAADAALVESLWSAVQDASGFQPVVDALARDGLAAIPPFALLDVTADSVRVIVRGGVKVVTPAETIDGTGVSTWTESVLPAGTTLSLDVAAASPAPVPPLPLEAGAAWIAALSLGAVVRPSRVEPVETSPVPTPAAKKPDTDPEATVTELPAAPAEEPAEDGYDYLFGDTVFRNVADAAVHAEDPEADTSPDENTAGDHDGQTVLTSDIAKLRASRKTRKPAEAAPAPAPTPAAVLALANGTRETLVQPILVGRAPSVSQVSGGQVPRLVTIGTADQDISRTHARFALEGGTVVVTDLHSRNGTTIKLPGKEPQKLRAGEPTSVITGTVVDFGGGVTITVEES